MDNDEIAQQYCESNRDNRFGIALNQARQSERAEIVEMLKEMRQEQIDDYNEHGGDYDTTDYDEIIKRIESYNTPSKK